MLPQLRRRITGAHHNTPLRISSIHAIATFCIFTLFARVAMECGAAVLCCAGKSRLPSLTRSLHCIAPNRFHHRLPTRRFSTGNFQLHPCSFIIDDPIASPILSLPSLPLSTLKIFRPTCYLGFHCACNCIVVTRLRGCPPVVPDHLLGHVHALQTTQCHLCRVVLHCPGTIKRCVSTLLARNRYTDARMRRTNPRVSRTRRYQPVAWLLSTDRRAAAASLCLHLDISSPDVVLLQLCYSHHCAFALFSAHVLRLRWPNHT